MFTGIIESKSEILSISGGRFRVKNIFNSDDLNVGQSIAHDGACMTLENFNKDYWEFFVMEESFKKTNFDSKKSGDFFNIERCLKLGDRLDGHIVSGHIDSKGKVIDIIEVGDSSKIIKFNLDIKYTKFLIQKGSVTINGVSLTVIDLGKDFFSVSLIPMTQEITNLGNLNLGNIVNLEFDMIGKYVNSNLKKLY